LFGGEFAEHFAAVAEILEFLSPPTAAARDDGSGEFTEFEGGEEVFGGGEVEEGFDGFLGAEGDEGLDVLGVAAEAGAIEEVCGSGVVPAFGLGFPKGVERVSERGHGGLARGWRC